jgi:predicted nucleotidyltransferase
LAGREEAALGNSRASQHRRILPGVLSLIRAADPDCAVVLSRSVSDGREREDSDLGLFVVSPLSRATPLDGFADHLGQRIAAGDLG